MNDFLHTWELDENSWLIRFYRFWYWEPNLSTLSFCKLFWAVVCAPLMGLAWLIVMPLMKLVVWIDKRSEQKQSSTASSRSKKKATAIASGVGSFFDRVSAFFQRYNWLAAPLFWTAIVIGGIVAVGGTGYGIVRLVALIHGNLYWKVWWSVIRVLLIVLWIVLGELIFVRGISNGKHLRPWAKSVGRFIATGYHAVKYRTCPKVVVKKKL